MAFDRRQRSTHVCRGALSAAVVTVLGLLAHSRAGGTPPGALATILTTGGLSVAFAGVARGSLRPRTVAPLAGAAQVLLHGLGDLAAGHAHHTGVGEALRCLVSEPAMLVAHGLAVLLTVLVLLVLEPLLEPGRLLPGTAESTAVPVLGAVPAPKLSVRVRRVDLSDHAPRRGPPVLLPAA